MKQSSLPFATPERKSKTNAAIERDYDRVNLECAHEILSDIDRFGGADAYPAIWARCVVERLERKEAA
jgi:hypothetical protein